MAKDPLLRKTLKIALFVILPLLTIFLILNATITGFSIKSETGIATGSFLAIIIIFFTLLLFLIKLRPKTYKPPI